MLDRVSVLIPYQSDHNGPRDSALKWVLGFYARALPEAEVCVGEIEDSRELFSRSKALIVPIANLPKTLSLSRIVILSTIRIC